MYFSDISQEYIKLLTLSKNAVQYTLSKFIVGHFNLDFFMLIRRLTTRHLLKISRRRNSTFPCNVQVTAFHENARESYVGGIVVICKHSRERLYFIQFLFRKKYTSCSCLKIVHTLFPKKSCFRLPRYTNPRILYRFF